MTIVRSTRAALTTIHLAQRVREYGVGGGGGRGVDLFARNHSGLIGLLLDKLTQVHSVHGVLPLSICARQRESAQQPAANIDSLASVNLFTTDCSEGMFNFPVWVTCLIIAQSGRCVCVFPLVLLSAEGSVWIDSMVPALPSADGTCFEHPQWRDG